MIEKVNTFFTFCMKINEIRPQESEFTEVLEHIALKPELLYYRGILPEKRVKTVAIVGSRRNTKYGEEIAYTLAKELAKRGVVVVSGLALGIDSIAHRGALDGGGVTIGILGTEIERIYPREHVGLAEKMIENGGAVMSEYHIGDKIFPKTSFLERNRLISGLSDAVVVVEAAERSGTLNTAMHALDQGKELFAVPGDITHAMSAGCNSLLQHGAYPYTKPDDVLDFLFPVKHKKKSKQMVIFGDTEEETKILQALMSGMEDGEEIMMKLGMGVTEFNQTVTLLEIKGLIKSLGANKWVLG